MRLLLSYTILYFLPPAVPSPGCLSFRLLATTSLWDTLLEPLLIYMRIRLERVGLPPPFSWNHSFRYVSFGRKRRRSSNTQRGPGNLIEISTGLRHKLLGARRARPSLTTLTDLPLRYEERGAWSTSLGKHYINSNRATAPPYTLKNDFKP